MPELRSGTILPTPEEDEDITAAALSDPDNPPLTDEILAQMKLIRLRGRPVAKHRKTSISLRIDPDVLEFYKAMGKGWQSRMNEVLADYKRSHKA